MMQGSISFYSSWVFAVGLELLQNFGVLFKKRSEVCQCIQGIRTEVMLDTLDVAGLRIIIEIK